MPAPDFTAEATALHDMLLNPPAIDRERAVALIRTGLASAFAEGKVAGIDSALAIFKTQETPSV